MGPTPPGTGVIAAAFGATESKSTSPTILVFEESAGSVNSVYTDIDNYTPSFTMSPVTVIARPAATTRISACFV
jgi:hypothetical protein